MSSAQLSLLYTHTHACTHMHTCTCTHTHLHTHAHTHTHTVPLYLVSTCPQEMCQSLLCCRLKAAACSDEHAHRGDWSTVLQ